MGFVNGSGDSRLSVFYSGSFVILSIVGGDGTLCNGLLPNLEAFTPYGNQLCSSGDFCSFVSDARLKVSQTKQVWLG